ncbi:MAG: Rpn family recombination-promoting nuclease/putative transposase [Caldilineaceae bacterium]|nr:Rpn family recombination-promoting nuclease/putative transposase [Caldilineaceae bacterium]
MTNIHDSGYKILFSNRTIFRQLMESFILQPWVDQLDFDSAERVDKSFVSEEYQTTESDLIYRLPWNEDELYVYVLMEFQSSVDHWMVLRMLNYITNFYMAWHKEHKDSKKLPPIFPLLLYNGDERWSAAQTMDGLVESEPSLGDYAIGFRYFKLAVNEFSQEQLLDIQNIVSALFLAESRPDIDLLTNQFVALFDSEEDKQAISLFLNWYKQLAIHGRVRQEDYASLAEVYRSAEEVRSMLQTTFAQERQRWLEEGREEGREKGREEGREEGREQGIAQVAWTMHRRGFALSVIADITGLSEDELNMLLTSAPPDDVNS